MKRGEQAKPGQNDEHMNRSRANACTKLYLKTVNVPIIKFHDEEKAEIWGNLNY